MTAKREEPGIPWFPADYIFACIDKPTAAAGAARELRKAGFHAEEMQLLSGDEVLQRIECEHCNFVARVFRTIWKVMTDEGTIMDGFEQEAHAGRSILAVHVTTQDRVDDVRRILAACGAHRVEYCGRGVMKHLSPA